MCRDFIEIALNFIGNFAEFFQAALEIGASINEYVLKTHGEGPHQIFLILAFLAFLYTGIKFVKFVMQAIYALVIGGILITILFAYKELVS